MDTNKMRDLKALAEACQQHQPLRFMRSHGALYIRNDNGIVFDVHQNRSFPDFMAQNKDYADLALACTPATILALLAEIERTEGRLHDAAELCATVEQERDQLKAENERLTEDAARYRWLRNPENDVAILFGGHAWEDLSSEYMDGSIDAAIAKEASHG